MIKNIVFDIGNVLLSYKPDKYLANFNFDDITREKIFQSIFKSRYWIELDRGTLADAEALELFCTSLPELQKEITDVFSNWCDMLKPDMNVVNIVKELKRKGYNIYLLSNFHKKAFERVRSENDFFDIFDGGIISCDVNLVKPEEEIYKMLLRAYNLKAEETMFIDDTKENIEGADKLGIYTVLFKGSDELIEVLKNKNIL